MSEWVLTRTVVGGFTGCEGDARDDGDCDGSCCGGLSTLWELATLISTPLAGLPARSLARGGKQMRTAGAVSGRSLWVFGALGMEFFLEGGFAVCIAELWVLDWPCLVSSRQMAALSVLASVW